MLSSPCFWRRCSAAARTSQSPGHRLGRPRHHQNQPCAARLTAAVAAPAPPPSARAAPATRDRERWGALGAGQLPPAARGAVPRPPARLHRTYVCQAADAPLRPFSAPQVRFSDDLEIQEEPAASRTPNGKGHSRPEDAPAGSRTPNGSSRPPRSPRSPQSPQLHTIPSETALSMDAAAQGETARAAGGHGAAAGRRSGEHPQHSHSHGHQHPHSGQHPHSSQHPHGHGGHSKHPRRHSGGSRHAPDAPPPPEEVAAAVGPGGEAESQPGSLAECARLFHKVGSCCCKGRGVGSPY